MQKRTTTQKINTALTNHLLQIIKAEKYNKTTHKIEMIAPETFIESLEFICETIFADSIGWYYRRNHVTGQYEAECSRMDGSVDFIITVYLDVCGGVNVEDIERTLEIVEE